MCSVWRHDALGNSASVVASAGPPRVLPGRVGQHWPTVSVHYPAEQMGAGTRGRGCHCSGNEIPGVAVRSYGRSMF